MTTLTAASESMYDEVCGRIAAITPHKFTDHPFIAVALEDRNSRAWIERTGRERLFDVDINNPAFARLDFSGSTTMGLTLDYPVRVWYPTAPGWSEAAVGDYSNIKMNLEQNPTTTDGVCLRFIVEGPKLIAHGKDPWQYLELGLRVVYSVTRS